jgi:hypothetical protein
MDNGVHLLADDEYDYEADKFHEMIIDELNNRCINSTQWFNRTLTRYNYIEGLSVEFISEWSHIPAHRIYRAIAAFENEMKNKYIDKYNEIKKNKD